MVYDPREQDEIIEAFSELLRLPTADGGRKRAAGTKVPWRIDPGHKDAFWRHLKRQVDGDTIDADSGAPAWGHIAWRACALALQDRHRGEPGWLA